MSVAEEVQCLCHEHVVVLEDAAVARVRAVAVITLVWPPSFLDDLDRDRQKLAPADRVRAVYEERRTVGAVLAGIGAAIGLWYTTSGISSTVGSLT